MSNDERSPRPAQCRRQDSVPSPAPTAPTAPGGYWQPAGFEPDRVGGVFYGTGLVILLTIVTLGIWGIFWTYRTSEDLKKYNGDASAACSGS